MANEKVYEVNLPSGRVVKYRHPLARDFFRIQGTIPHLVGSREPTSDEQLELNYAVMLKTVCILLIEPKMWVDLRPEDEIQRTPFKHADGVIECDLELADLTALVQSINELIEESAKAIAPLLETATSS